MRYPQRFLLGLSLLFVCTVLVPALRAQESFRATHVCQLSTVFGIPQDEHSAGLAIFTVDRATLNAEFRISLGASKSPYTSITMLSRVGPDTYAMLQEFAWEPGLITATGTLTLNSLVLQMLDEGNVYMGVQTEDEPDILLRGQVEQLPAAIALSLSAAEETAAVDSDGEGSARIYYDPTSGGVRYEVEWSALTGPATMAHFHRGARGTDGPIVHTLSFTPGDSVVKGAWPNISTEDLAALRSGGLYVNVHTAAYQSGEVRGQVLPAQTFTAAIESEHEVPPATLSAATGTGVFVLMGTEQGGMTAVGTAVVDGTLDSSVTAAHVHRGAIGVNGPAVMDLYASSDPIYRNQEQVTESGSLNFMTVDSIRNDNSYMNFHTPTYPDGELRGQLIGAASNFASVKAFSPSLKNSVVSAWSREGTVYVQTEESRTGTRALRLYTMLGRRVAASVFNGAAGSIDASGLPNGAYFVELVEDGVQVGTCPVLLTR